MIQSGKEGDRKRMLPMRGLKMSIKTSAGITVAGAAKLIRYEKQFT